MPVPIPLCHLPDLSGAGGAHPKRSPTPFRAGPGPVHVSPKPGRLASMGLGGGPPVSPRSRDPVLGLDLPAQLPTPRSAPTPSPRPVLTKAAWGCWPLRMGGDRGGSPTPDLGHTPTALSGRTSQVGAVGPGRPGSPHLCPRKAGGAGTRTLRCSDRTDRGGDAGPNAGYGAGVWGEGGMGMGEGVRMRSQLPSGPSAGSPLSPAPGVSAGSLPARRVCAKEVFLGYAVSADPRCVPRASRCTSSLPYPHLGRDFVFLLRGGCVRFLT